MSKEKTQESIGKLLDTEAQRDAIHIAVAPVYAPEQVWPGQHVNVGGGLHTPHIGIVDPFLRGAVHPGERYFIFLYPNTITSIRHEWTHPAFGTVAVEKISQLDHAEKSRAWIADHAETLGLSARALMENATEWLRTDKHFVQMGSEQWRDNFNPTEFWHHYEIARARSSKQRRNVPSTTAHASASRAKGDCVKGTVPESGGRDRIARVMVAALAEEYGDTEDQTVDEADRRVADKILAALSEPLATVPKELLSEQYGQAGSCHACNRGEHCNTCPCCWTRQAQIEQPPPPGRRAALERLVTQAVGAVHSLRSYQFGNDEPALAEESADALEKALAAVEREPGAGEPAP